MSDAITIARPYAKAIFEHALANKHLALWSGTLYDLAQVVSLQDTMEFITNPSVTIEQQVQLLLAIIIKAKRKQEMNIVENFIRLLAINKRLQALPYIYALYEELRALQEKTLIAKVRSFQKLSSKQELNLKKSLSQRLQREVTLDLTIDKSLLGGAVISAGDLVIDGSVRAKLNKLKTNLAA